MSLRGDSVLKSTDYNGGESEYFAQCIRSTYRTYCNYTLNDRATLLYPKAHGPV